VNVISQKWVNARNTESNSALVQQADGTEMGGARKLRYSIPVEIYGQRKNLEALLAPFLPHDLILGVVTCKKLATTSTEKDPEGIVAKCRTSINFLRSLTNY
jgi:hypothetical protein